MFPRDTKLRLLQRAKKTHNTIGEKVKFRRGHRLRQGGGDCTASASASAHPPGTTPLVAMALIEMAVSMVCRERWGADKSGESQLYRPEGGLLLLSLLSCWQEN